jgi:hypothetical protein
VTLKSWFDTGYEVQFTSDEEGTSIESTHNLLVDSGSPDTTEEAKTVLLYFRSLHPVLA